MTELPGPAGLRANLGLLRTLLAEPCDALDAGAARYGGTFRVGVGPLTAVVVGEPAHADALLALPNEAFRWGHWANVLRFAVGSESLIVSDGELHKRRRGAVQPSFARRRLDGWIPMMVTEIDRTIDEFTRSVTDEVDLFPVERELALRLVSRVLFGAGLDARVGRVGAAMEPLKEYLELPAMRQLPHPLPRTRRTRARAGRRALLQLIEEEIARRADEHDRAGHDLLDDLVAARDAGALSHAEVLDQVVTLIGAGYDTTTSALAWTTIRAAHEPGVWTRLRAEADVAFGEPPGPATLEGLVFARAVVRETLRLHPPGVFTPRRAVRAVRVGPYEVPAGAMVLWSPYLTGRSVVAWTDPTEFRPDRHLDPGDSDDQRAWVPFGRGARSCIGAALAQIELTLAIARLAQRIDVELAAPAVPRPSGMVVNRPTGGVRARVWPRQARPVDGASAGAICDT